MNLETVQNYNTAYILCVIILNSF